MLAGDDNRRPPCACDGTPSRGMGATHVAGSQGMVNSVPNQHHCAASLPSACDVHPSCVVGGPYDHAFATSGRATATDRGQAPRGRWLSVLLEPTIAQTDVLVDDRIHEGQPWISQHRCALEHGSATRCPRSPRGEHAVCTGLRMRGWRSIRSCCRADPVGSRHASVPGRVSAPCAPANDALKAARGGQSL